jgi:hypothetical protein
MTTFTSLEEDALTILSFYKRYNLRTGGVLHYSGLCSDARSAGINVKEFRAAIDWLTDNRLLDIPATPADSYVLTVNGFIRAG